MEHKLQYYAGKKVLITGGASFIGSHLSELLLANGAKITVADDFSSGRPENLASIRSDINVLHVDLRDTESAQAATRSQEIVFHLAAAHGGRGFIDTHPVECVANMALDHQVFAAAATSGVEKIIHASSACVYPTNLQASTTELNFLSEAQANFDSPGGAFSDGEYGWAKLMGELQLRAFTKQFPIDGVACRIFTAYGERENESHAVVALIAKALARLDPYPIWGDGQQTRNFTYVGDTVRGLALAGSSLSGFEVLNVGSSSHDPVLKLCEAIFEILGWRPNEFDFQLDKPVGVLSRASDNSKILSVTGWEPATSLLEGVARTIDYCQSEFTEERLAALESRLMAR
jgi:nucleoside-diphosphate-sugar epimerase